jgi:hypothetical protein
VTLTRNQILALFTAHPDTWELAGVPDWLAEECVDLGLVVKTPRGKWRLTLAGSRERKKRLGEA